MVARHCVTNSKFLPEKIQMEKYQVGANVYNLDLNVALVHDWELASTWAENLGMPLLLRAACGSFLFLSFSFSWLVAAVPVSLSSPEIPACLGQGNTTVEFVSSLPLQLLLC